MGWVSGRFLPLGSGPGEFGLERISRRTRPVPSAGGGGSAWPSPDRSGSIWEPAPVRSGNPAGDYPGPDHPGTQHGDPDQGDLGHGDPDYGDLGHGDPGYDDPEYDPDSGSYSGTEFPGPDYPAPGDHSTSRAHAARGREWADEPGEGDW